MRRNYKRNSSHSGFLHCYDSLFLIMKSLLTDIGDCCIKYIRRRVKTSLTGILDNSDDETNTDCLQVFTTTSTDHALERIQVLAQHYLVKPFTEADIDALTDELLARIPQPDKYMELKVEGSEIHLRYQDIVYAEHFAHLIYVHTTVQKTLATRQPFKTFIAPLKDDTRFFVCGRGVIVNLEHAKDLEGAAFRMADGSRVFVSQDLLKSARQALMEFLLQRGRMA